MAACAGEVLGVKTVSMNYRTEGKRRSLSIPSLAEMEIEAVTGLDGGEATMSNMPFCVAPGYPSVLAKSKKFTYRDHGYGWEFSDKNGFYSAFSYQG